MRRRPESDCRRDKALGRRCGEVGRLLGKKRKECRYSDGPDSKTMIDLKNSENGKPAPLYDQYENHCRIDSHATGGHATTLKLTCFEFWDDYKA